MKTRDQVLEAIRAGRKSECLDGRDYGRLLEFFPSSDWLPLGFVLRDAATKAPFTPLDWTRENILTQLEKDVRFGFEKALDKRGISASFMHSTVKMWMWVLDDPLEHMEEYAQYGLPLFKAVALKYGLPNPIGANSGSEYRYSTEADEE